MNKEELLNLTIDLAAKDLTINKLEREISNYIENFIDFIDIDNPMNNDVLIKLAEKYDNLYKLKNEKEKLLTKVSIGYRCLLK